jgi:hypothetical protein
MADAWLTWCILVATGAAVFGYLRMRSAKPLVFANPREERLARRLTGVVGCTLAQALQAVRKEVDMAPKQSDETLLKRAAYHYRQERPESACPVYRDEVPG